MTATLPRLGTRASRPAPAPPAQEEARPVLRVVDKAPRPAAHRARAGVTAVLVLIVVAAALFGLVASHVSLAQGQFRLEELRDQAVKEQDRYERLRLQVAELESPGRVVAAAQERLGMVPPPGVTYLSPLGPTSGVEPGADETGATQSWSEVKRQLASGP